MDIATDTGRTAGGIVDMDPVTFEVLRNALINATEQMALTVKRVAFSTNIKTRADFSCGFFDAKLRCIAQSFAQPSHLVAMATIVPASVRGYGAANLRPGDGLLVNDPHLGSSHLNDVVCILPVFDGPTLLGFVANMAHHVDVGGQAPASLALAKELFQEGIIIPPTRAVVGGEYDPNVLNLVLANLRAPRETRGDLKAQLSANLIGARRVLALCHSHGQAQLERFFDELLAYTARWTEREIRALPQGVFTAEGFRDDDGFSDTPLRLAVSVTVAGGRVVLDVTGSSPQTASPINCTRSMSAAALAFVVRCLSAPGLSVNAGFLSRLEVTGPDGTFCTAVRPAAVVGGWEVAQKLAEVILLAFHPVLPDIIPASGKAVIVNLGMGGLDTRTNETFCYMETIAGGGGARPGLDGANAVQTNLHNTENAPIEEVEVGYPMRIARYELIPDSGGAGELRGGLSVRRDFEFPYGACSMTLMTDGAKFAPWGLSGGADGRAARFFLIADGETRPLPSKGTFDVPKGGIVRVETPGGGGFGPPHARPSAALLDDVADGYVSPSAARAVYGQEMADPAGTSGPAGARPRQAHEVSRSDLVTTNGGGSI